MESLTDKQAIEKIKNGEINYFSVIVRKYSSRIYHYTYKKIFEKKDVDDIVQDSFISFYKSVNSFNENKPILPYLFEILKNEIKMYFRSKKKTVALDEKINVFDEKNDLYNVKEEYKDLNKLSSDQKSALKLLSEGYSYKEIATKLNKPLNTVRAIIRRGRLKMQNQILKIK